uniref:SGNH hydrolase-type esterase domain-containing protein n=2 Tax=Anabas testudineus TaxID=64144 RepID=A0A7N6FDJ8_ANATE
DADRLRENLKFCEAGQPMITPRSDFDEFQEAENVVQVLWPNCPGALKKEMSLQDSLAEARSQSDDGKTLSSSNDGRRTESGKTTGPQTLIVGDFVITGMKGIKIKKTRVYCFPGDLVSDITERLPSLLAEHPTVKNIIVHLGATDIMKRPSEGLKQDFRDLLNALSSFDTQVFISGPLPPVRVRTERFSRLLALNKWLLTECRRPNVHFIDNFDRFWKRRRLFREDGINLSKLGLKLLISNLKSKMKSTGHFYSL